jgi:hypothetical protein
MKVKERGDLIFPRVETKNKYNDYHLAGLA